MANHDVNLARITSQKRLANRAKAELEYSFSSRFSLTDFAGSLDISPRTQRGLFNREFGCSEGQRNFSGSAFRSSMRLLSRAFSINLISLDITNASKE
jgi:AraC-like DNA-binding protein